ncbi:MAG: hypothetical protein QM667_12115 [Asticcacaulis sp.]
MSRRYPKNVAGDFYVEDGCCLTCGVPEGEAADMFAWDEGAEYAHCYVSRQPETPADTETMLHVVWSAEAECIRYAGSDAEIIRRLVQSGEGNVCDDDSRHQYQVEWRDEVLFTLANTTPNTLAADFQAYLNRRRFVCQMGVITENEAVMRLSWYAPQFHCLRFHRTYTQDEWRAQIRPETEGAGRAVCRILQGWLDSHVEITNQKWSSRTERTAGIAQPFAY